MCIYYCRCIDEKDASKNIKLIELASADYNFEAFLFHFKYFENNEENHERIFTIFIFTLICNIRMFSSAIFFFLIKKYLYFVTKNFALRIYAHSQL